jgi:hypothetical protein
MIVNRVSTLIAAAQVDAIAQISCVYVGTGISAAAFAYAERHMASLSPGMEDSVSGVGCAR